MVPVTICLPNLNNRRYLPELIDSILAQTFSDWELVVVDNFSEDGAWEYFQELAARDSRIHISQAPKQGMYANWNNCLRLARGEFIYIATSDDKLAPDCIAKLHSALVRHPACGIAHCPPLMFGEDFQALQKWWWTKSSIARSVERRLDCGHIRRAPFDGFLHVNGESVIISITQMLIRRTVFDRVGEFPNDVGVVGDFEWQARAAFLFNSVFVPDTWGGWRLHAAQATAKNSASPGEKAKVNARLFERALDFYLTTPEGAHHRPWAGRLRAGARLHAVHLGGRGVGRNLVMRVAAVVRAALALGWGGLPATSPRGAVQLILKPEVYWITRADRILGRKSIEWL